MQRTTPTSLRDYIVGVASGDQTWRHKSACRDSSPTIVSMFTCSEDDTFELFGKQVSGYHVQTYLVTEYCHTCPVQWECARYAVQNEVDPKYLRAGGGWDFSGAWAMLRRDLRWLAKSPDPLGLIDQAKMDNVPVSVAVRDAREATE